MTTQYNAMISVAPQLPFGTIAEAYTFICTWAVAIDNANIDPEVDWFYPAEDPEVTGTAERVADCVAGIIHDLYGIEQQQVEEWLSCLGREQFLEIMCPGEDGPAAPELANWQQVFAEEIWRWVAGD